MTVNKSRCAIVSMLFLCLMTTAPADAMTEEGWRLRLHGFWVETKEGVVVRSGEAIVEDDAARGVGGGVSVEYRFATRWGAEFSTFAGSGNDLQVRLNSLRPSDTIGFDAKSVGVNFHSSLSSRVDFYGGPTLAYLSYDRLRLGTVSDSFPFRFTETSSASADRDLALGVSLGLDVPFGQKDHWFFNASMKFLDANIETEALGPRSSADFDPLLVGIGVGYCF